MTAVGRRFFAPEVVQTSKMDCGPASLKCLLGGFGIDVGYGRLREACQTDVDGTSIDVIEDVAAQLGLEAEQMMVPEDHLFLGDATPLPLLLVLNVPAAGTHFVVVWRRHGSLFQVMDPGFGRRWLTREALVADLYRHTMPVPAEDLREWAGSEKFLVPLRRRLSALRLPRAACDRLLTYSAADPGCGRLAALDAATRLVQRLVTSSALPRGKNLEPLLARLTTTTKESGSIPETFWSFWPTNDDSQEAILRGALLVTLGKRRAGGDPHEASTELRPELVRALAEHTESPWRALWRFVRKDGLLSPLVIAGALFVSAGAVGAQALLLRGLFDAGRLLGTGAQRMLGMVNVLVLLVAIALVSSAVSAGMLRIGRRLEIRLRVALLEKVPRIGDAFFQSRLVSDMAERAHAIAGLRTVPRLAFGLLGAAFQIVFTVAGVLWQLPSSAPVVLGACVTSAIAAWLSHPWLTERDLRVRGHNASLLRYTFDAFMGLSCIRAHGAGPALMREQESHLVHWSGAQRALQRTAVLVEGLQTTLGYGLAIWLLMSLRAGQEGRALLLAYWALQLPTLAQSLVANARQIPMQHNITERLLEPLSTPEDAPTEASRERVGAHRGAEIHIHDVTVRAGGKPVLEHLDLQIAAGRHVAIVGASGSGKSTLAALLLGFQRPATGSITIDGAPLGDSLAQLRREMAWVDPAVQLWNERFIDNLTYSAGSAATVNDVGWAVQAADLREVLARLPEGLQTSLGEGGALVSGGEGQRVRLARAFMQRNVRLAILDEPFRGLDRTQRSTLLARTRELWANATLLCATHDVAETMSFDRVIVIHEGKVIEDGRPQTLAGDATSHYGAMLAAERAVHERLWDDAAWRRIRIDHGRLTEEARR